MHLARRRFLDRAKVDLFRNFECRELLATIGNEFLGCHFLTVFESDKGTGYLTPLLITCRHHCSLEYFWMAKQNRLNFEG